MKLYIVLKPRRFLGGDMISSCFYGSRITTKNINLWEIKWRNSRERHSKIFQH